tara:strand:- start:851 stop:1375 length:525 start_codon:yes stop_codon:yes gene_type:complete
MSRVLSIFLIIILIGCGYTTRSIVSFAEDTIIIEPVVNEIDITSERRKFADYTTFPILIENKLTNELVSKFNIDGNFKVVSQDPEALVLTCVIDNYTKETLRYENNDDIEEQRLRLYVKMKLTSPKGEVLKDKQVVGEATFFLTGVNSKSEVAAQVDLVDDTARRISEAIVEAW